MVTQDRKHLFNKIGMKCMFLCERAQVLGALAAVRVVRVAAADDHTLALSAAGEVRPKNEVRQ